MFYDDHKALYVVTQEQPGIYEIKNIVTVPKYQRKGYSEQYILEFDGLKTLRCPECIKYGITIG